MAKKKNKKEEHQIFNSIRKLVAPPTVLFKTRKKELDRKRKHKKQDLE